MSNRRDIQFLYNPHNKATLLDCSFTVAPADAGGLGITGLQKSGRIASVFMHTSQTPAGGNPNPESGIIIVNLQDNYNSYLGGFAQFDGPLSGSSIDISGSAVMTVGAVYVITSVGTSTAADWQAVGLKAGIVPAVGVSFIASVTGGGTGTGTVQAPASTGAGVDHLEPVGNPAVMNSNAAQVLGGGQGMQLIFAAYKNTALTAPATGSIIRLGIYLNNSAQGV